MAAVVHFPVGGSANRGDDPGFVMRQMGFGVADQVSLIKSTGVAEFNRRNDPLAETRVRNAHDACVHHELVALQHFFDFFGEDLFAGGINAL